MLIIRFEFCSALAPFRLSVFAPSYYLIILTTGIRTIIISDALMIVGVSIRSNVSCGYCRQFSIVIIY